MHYDTYDTPPRRLEGYSARRLDGVGNPTLWVVLGLTALVLILSLAFSYVQNEARDRQDQRDQVAAQVRPQLRLSDSAGPNASADRAPEASQPGVGALDSGSPAMRGAH